MKIYIQWTTNPASDWIQYDHRDWPNLPTKPEPKGGETIDSFQGWPFRVNVQGVIFAQDHISMFGSNETLLVKAWNDDPEDFEKKDMVAVDFVFNTLAPDPSIGGRINTRQTRELYKGFPFQGFIKPTVTVIRHGILVSDELFRQHMEFPIKGWMDWQGDNF